MAYITNADIQERLGDAAYVQLTDDDGDGIADVGVVDEARVGAEGEVNGYLAMRYLLPIDLSVHTDSADVLASVALDLAEYRLRSRRPPVPDEAVRRHTQAIAWLQSVSQGTIELPSTAGGVPAGSRGPIAEVTGEDRILSHDEMSDF